MILIREDIFWALVLLLMRKNTSQGDHLIRIRQRGFSCTIINVHYKPEDTLQEHRRRLRGAAAFWQS